MSESLCRFFGATMLWLYALVGMWLLYVPAPMASALPITPDLGLLSYELGIPLLWSSVVGGLAAALFILMPGQWTFAVLGVLFFIFGPLGYLVLHYLLRHRMVLSVASSLVAMSSTVSYMVFMTIAGPLASGWPPDTAFTEIALTTLLTGCMFNVVNIILFLRVRPAQ
ncbi:MAG: hypothetical protein Q7S95_01175 [bacterium]|nr:hypothetical protein [bacterium]